MREDAFKDVGDGIGKAFGTDVYDFAKAYARGNDVDLNRDDPLGQQHGTVVTNSCERTRCLTEA